MHWYVDCERVFHVTIRTKNAMNLLRLRHLGAPSFPRIHWPLSQSPSHTSLQPLVPLQRDAVALAVSLGLEPGEAVLESFPCHLLQTYRSVNGLTPDREVPFPGTLHLTSLNAVFVAGQGAGLPDPVRLPLAAVRASHVTGAAVARPPRGSASAGQRLVLSATIAEGDIAFAGFREGGPESALALLEHLSSSD